MWSACVIIIINLYIFDFSYYSNFACYFCYSPDLDELVAKGVYSAHVMQEAQRGIIKSVLLLFDFIGKICQGGYLLDIAQALHLGTGLLCHHDFMQDI